MRYNIALLPKKVINYVISCFLWKVMRYVTFELLFKYEIIAGLRHILSLHFTVLIHFDEY